jgi:hypothetical protein
MRQEVFLGWHVPMIYNIVVQYKQFVNKNKNRGIPNKS